MRALDEDDDFGIRPGECPLRNRDTRYAVQGVVARTLPYLRHYLKQLADSHPDLDLTSPVIQDWVVELCRDRLFKGISG